MELENKTEADPLTDQKGWLRVLHKLRRDRGVRVVGEFDSGTFIPFIPDCSLEKTVIPAKAGIQVINKSLRKWDNIMGFVCFAARLDRWIPAFAGMTV